MSTVLARSGQQPHKNITRVTVAIATPGTISDVALGKQEVQKRPIYSASRAWRRQTQQWQWYSTTTSSNQQRQTQSQTIDNFQQLHKNSLIQPYQSQFWVDQLQQTSQLGISEADLEEQLQFQRQQNLTLIRRMKKAINEGNLLNDNPDLWQTFQIDAQNALPSLNCKEMIQVLGCFATATARLTDFTFFAQLCKKLHVLFDNISIWQDAQWQVQLQVQQQQDGAIKQTKPRIREHDNPDVFSYVDLKKLIISFGKLQMLDSRLMTKIEVQILSADTGKQSSKSKSSSMKSKGQQGQQILRITKYKPRDLVHIMIAYSRLQLGLTAINQDSSHDQSSREQLFNLITSSLSDYIYDLTPPEVAHLIHSMIKLRLYDDELVDAIVHETVFSGRGARTENNPTTATTNANVEVAVKGDTSGTSSFGPDGLSPLSSKHKEESEWKQKQLKQPKVGRLKEFSGRDLLMLFESLTLLQADNMLVNMQNQKDYIMERQKQLEKESLSTSSEDVDKQEQLSWNDGKCDESKTSTSTWWSSQWQVEQSNLTLLQHRQNNDKDALMQIANKLTQFHLGSFKFPELVRLIQSLSRVPSLYDGKVIHGKILPIVLAKLKQVDGVQELIGNQRKQLAEQKAQQQQQQQQGYNYNSQKSMRPHLHPQSSTQSTQIQKEYLMSKHATIMVPLSFAETASLLECLSRFPLHSQVSKETVALLTGVAESQFSLALNTSSSAKKYTAYKNQPTLQSMGLVFVALQKLKLVQNDLTCGLPPEVEIQDRLLDSSNDDKNTNADQTVDQQHLQQYQVDELIIQTQTQTNTSQSQLYFGVNLDHSIARLLHKLARNEKLSECLLKEDVCGATDREVKLFGNVILHAVLYQEGSSVFEKKLKQRVLGRVQSELEYRQRSS